MASKGKFLLLGLLGAAAAAVALLSGKKASAASLPTSEAPQVDEPKNAAEAYSLAMNPSVKDPEYVHSLAVWLNRFGNRPDWAAAAERRAVDLRAEQVLAKGLLATTPVDEVVALGQTLAPTHPAYSAVLGTRLVVERGAKPPPPFTLELASGGSLAINMAIYAHSAPTATAPALPVPSPVAPATPSIVPPAPTPQQAAQAPAQPVPQYSTSTTAGKPPVPVPPPPPLAVSTPSGQTAAVPVVLPASATPLAAQELQPESDPYGTLALCRVLLAEQNKAGWKFISPAVKAWQAKVGMKADGKFGPGGALRMAQECIILPWVRYWALGVGDGSKQAALNDYRSKLKAYAQSLVKTKPEAAANLMVAADRETGQGWPDKPSASPAKPLPTKKELDGAASSLLYSSDIQSSVAKGKK